MKAWNNIEVSSDDKEIAAIDRMEQTLRKIPKQVYKVRELITRFEVCHFKYQRHYRHILESIAALNPTVDVDGIGLCHPRHGEEAIKNDATGRSKIGQQYISGLRTWLGEAPDTSNSSQDKTTQRVAAWLGERNDTKGRLVRLLLARLLYQPLEDYCRGGKFEKLEYHVMATDICSYSFPENLEQVIQAIGELKPVKNFKGCGTYNTEIESFISKEFERLCSWLNDKPNQDLRLGQKGLIKVWLVACLAKTIKEQVHLNEPISELSH